MILELLQKGFFQISDINNVDYERFELKFNPSDMSLSIKFQIAAVDVFAGKTLEDRKNAQNVKYAEIKDKIIFDLSTCLSTNVSVQLDNDTFIIRTNTLTQLIEKYKTDSQHAMTIAPYFAIRELLSQDKNRIKNVINNSSLINYATDDDWAYIYLTQELTNYHELGLQVSDVLATGIAYLIDDKDKSEVIPSSYTVAGEGYPRHAVVMSHANYQIFLDKWNEPAVSPVGNPTSTSSQQNNSGINAIAPPVPPRNYNSQQQGQPAPVSDFRKVLKPVAATAGNTQLKPSGTAVGKAPRSPARPVKGPIIKPPEQVVEPRPVLRPVGERVIGKAPSAPPADVPVGSAGSSRAPALQPNAKNVGGNSGDKDKTAAQTLPSGSAASVVNGSKKVEAIGNSALGNGSALAPTPAARPGDIKDVKDSIAAAAYIKDYIYINEAKYSFKATYITTVKELFKNISEKQVSLESSNIIAELCDLFDYINAENNKKKINIKKHPWFDFFFHKPNTDTWIKLVRELRNDAYEKLLQITTAKYPGDSDAQKRYMEEYRDRKLFSEHLDNSVLNVFHSTATVNKIDEQIKIRSKYS